MAVVAFPRILSQLFAPNHHFVLGRRSTKYVCRVSRGAEARESRIGSAIVWFKQDLRVDDHLGLIAASKYQTVVPLYVFDHRILSCYSDDTLELVLFALEDLRKSLKEKGCNLMIRFGRVENVLQELVEEVKATNIFAEEEVEYHLRMMMALVDETLGVSSFKDGKPKICLWQTPFYDIKNLNDLHVSHCKFMKLQLPLTSPVLPPTLPGAELEMDWGSVPTFDDLKEFMNESPSKLKESWTSMMSAETILLEKLSKLGERSRKNSNIKQAPGKRPDNSVFVTQKGNIVGGGTDAILNALAAYLKYLEGTARDDWQEYVMN